MKAIVKNTGEVVNVRPCSEPMNVRLAFYETEHGRKFPVTALEFEKKIDWEQRRYEVAKAALQSLLGNSDAMSATTLDCCRADEYGEQKTISQSISEYAIAFADVFIAELKKGGAE